MFFFTGSNDETGRAEYEKSGGDTKSNNIRSKAASEK